MNKTEALSKIMSALNGHAQIITPKGETYENYVAKLSSNLLDHVIDPIKVTVVSTCADNGDFDKYKKSNVWAIAKSKFGWLLTLENENEFALAFGDDPNEIIMHGFSSADVLAEWCS